ncbi:ABC transporter permease [Candidatus Hydrogenedentota bacterium]
MMNLAARVPSIPSVALFRREFLRSLRRGPSFVYLSIFVGACILCATAMWPKTSLNNFSLVTRRAKEMVQILQVMLYLGCMFFVPAFASTSIVSEKEQETFDLMKLTLISPCGIVMAKLINTIGFFIILIIASLPVLAVGFFVVGIAWSELILVAFLTLLITLVCAGISMLASALFRRSFLAVGGAYIFVLLFILGPVLMAWFIDDVLLKLPGDNFTEAAAMMFCPPVSVIMVYENDVHTIKFVIGIFYQLCVAAISLFISWRLLRRPAAPPKISHEKPIDDVTLLEQRRKTFPFYLIDPLRRKQMIEDRRNPMMVKELRWGLLNRGSVLIRLFYLTLVIYLILGVAIAMDTGDEGTEFAMVTFLCLTAALTPALTAGLLSKEYELGNIDMLSMTLLKPSQILQGKFWAGVLTLLPVLIAILIASVCLLLHSRSGMVIISGYITLLNCCFISLSAGMLASVLSKKTSVSLVLSYIFSAIIFVGIIGAAVMMIEAFDFDIDEDQAILMSPLFAFPLSLFEFSEFSTYLWSCSMFVYFLVGCGFIAGAISIFHRRLRRE